MTTFNIYCDESGHLPNDRQPTMVLGAITVSEDHARHLSDELRELKRLHGLAPAFEMKWTKISPAKVEFYRAAVDFFFDRPQLRMRVLVIPDKQKLNHEAFGQDHDTWYYKMYFTLLSAVLTRDDRYNIYLDIKDTRSAAKMRKLHDVLANSLYDFDKRSIRRVQTVRSHEIELLQLADMFIGAVFAAQRSELKSAAKKQIIERIREKSGFTLAKSTLLTESKFNLFLWRAQERRT